MDTTIEWCSRMAQAKIGLIFFIYIPVTYPEHATPLDVRPLPYYRYVATVWAVY